MWQRQLFSYYKVLVLFTSVFCNQLFAQEQQMQTDLSMRFAVPNFPPYIYLDENNKLSGEGISRVSKVLDQMALSYQFELVDNYGIALQQLSSGRIDGFFLATQNRYRDRVAEISDSVLNNNWSWFYKKNSREVADKTFKRNARIGTLLNTNTQIWLQDNGFTITTLSNDVETLVSMLLNDRLDAVFLSESVFLHALERYPSEQQKIASVIESSRDFSVYFSKEFLTTHRWFLDAFNGELAKLKAKEAY